MGLVTMDYEVLIGVDLSGNLHRNFDDTLSSILDDVIIASILRPDVEQIFGDVMVLSDNFTMTGVLQITTDSLPDATMGVDYAVQLEASGGNPPYTWSILTGTLPAGLTLSSDGLISGTPTETVSMANITFRVADSG